MTDELTDAVRRLKELQADVERLKAGDDQRGVPRLLFSQSETAVGRDRTDTRSRDAVSFEAAVGRDRTDTRSRDVVSFETAVGRDRQSELTLRDLQQSDVAEARDAQTDLRFQGRTRAGYQSRGRFGTATYAETERFERFESRLNIPLDTERELAGADVASRNTVGLEIRATSPVDIAVLVEQSGTGPLTAATLTDRRRVSEGFRVPDADTVRVFLTNTGSGVADVLLGTTR
jgi:hypothetical protein